MPGPPPKREAQRRRRNAPGTKYATKAGAPKKAATPGAVTIPDPNPDWHHAARGWYDAFQRSGQSVFFTDTDWYTAWAAADVLSRELSNPGPVNAAAIAQFFKACSILLACEGDRRRVGLELEREKPDEQGNDGSVSWLDAARRRSTG